MLAAGVAPDREGKTAYAKPFRYRREIAFREALGHLRSVIPIKHELRVASTESNKSDKNSLIRLGLYLGRAKELSAHAFCPLLNDGVLPVVFDAVAAHISSLFEIVTMAGDDHLSHKV